MATPARSDVRTNKFPSGLLSVIRVIDGLSDWSGLIVCWLIIPLVGSLFYEVVARYLFHAPTVWAFDVSYMLYGAFFMLGAGYALYRGGHIRTDMFYQNWPPWRQGLIDAICYLFFFFPGMFFLLWMGGHEAWHSWTIRETSDQSPWHPPLYPFKAVIPVTAFLLLVQGFAELLKSIYAIRTGRLYAKRETFEI